MEYYVVIPVYNEEAFLANMLDTLLAQTLLPKKIVIVNDHSTDRSENVIDTYLKKTNCIQKVNTSSSNQRMPGSKVINAFTSGLNILDENYDFIVKLDADLILPPNYFKTIATTFKSDSSIGIAGGFIYELDREDNWVLNHPMDKDHIRGAFKAYTKPCFKAIGGLKNAMGWDTIDELLAKYHGFALSTNAKLKVKHLRPTGKAYHKSAKNLQGKAMYRMRYGFWITCIASLKMAIKATSIPAFFNNMRGYLNAKKEATPYLVSYEEGIFIRQLRWRNIKKKIIN